MSHCCGYIGKTQAFLVNSDQGCYNEPTDLAHCAYEKVVINMTENWHISKSIPATLLLAIIGQTVGLVWYVSTLDASVATNAREIARHEVRIIEIEKTSQIQAVMLARIDENIKAIRMVIEKRAQN